MRYIYMRPEQYSMHWCQVLRAMGNIDVNPHNYGVLAESGTWLRASNAGIANAFVSQSDGAIPLDVNPGQEQSARNAVNKADADFTAALHAGEVVEMYKAAIVMGDELLLAFSRGPQEYKPKGPPFEGSKP